MSAPPARGQRGGQSLRAGRGRTSSPRGQPNNRVLSNTSTRGRGRARGTVSNIADGLLQKLRSGTVQRGSDNDSKDEGLGRGTPRGEFAQTARGRGRGHLTRTFNTPVTSTPSQKAQESPAKPTSYGDFMNNMNTKFQALKATRDGERSKAIRDGFLADPEKKVSLDKAITPVGTCTEMCPEFERVERIVQNMVDKAEKIRDESSGRDIPFEDRMVKRFRRSAAGYDEQLPSDIRTPQTLKRTLDYLLDKIIEGGERLASIHKFVWDRTRGIRNDFSIQQVTKEEDVRIAVDCYERIARFHILSLHQLANTDNLLEGENFDAHQEREQLNNTLLSLMYYYDDHRYATAFPNEGEFRAYCIILELQTQHPDLEDRMQAWPLQLLTDKRVQVAFKLYSSASNTLSDQGPLRPLTPFSIAQANAGVFWNLLSSKAVPYLMACVSEIYFSQIRFTALDAIWRSSKNAPTAQQARSRDWTLNDLTHFLAFDTERQTLDFCAAFDLSFNKDENDEQYLDLTAVNSPSLDKSSIPNQQIFSRNYVEEKRYQRTLGAVINGISVSQAIHEGLIEADDEFEDKIEETKEDDQSMFIPENQLQQSTTNVSQNRLFSPTTSGLNPQAPAFTSKFGETLPQKPAETPKFSWPGSSATFSPAVSSTTVNNTEKISTPSFFPQQPAQEVQSKSSSGWTFGEFNTGNATSTPVQQSQSPFSSQTFAAKPSSPTPDIQNSPLIQSGFQSPSTQASFNKPSPFFSLPASSSTPSSINPPSVTPNQPFKQFFDSPIATGPKFPGFSGLNNQSTIVNQPTESDLQAKEATQSQSPETYRPSPEAQTQLQSSLNQQPSSSISKAVFPFSPLSAPNQAIPSISAKSPASEPTSFFPTPKRLQEQSKSVELEKAPTIIESAASFSKPEATPVAKGAFNDLKPSNQIGTAVKSPVTPPFSRSSESLQQQLKTAKEPDVIKKRPVDLVDVVTKLSLLQQKGLMQEYLEFILPDILRSVFNRHQREVFDAKVVSIRDRILARKFGRIWRERSWRNNLNRRARHRRYLLAETLKAEELKKAKAEDELKAILGAMEEKNRIQHELTKTLEEAKAARKQQESDKGAIQQGQVAGKKRKDTSEHRTSGLEHSNRSGQPHIHHKRSRTIGGERDRPTSIHIRQSPLRNTLLSSSNAHQSGSPSNKSVLDRPLTSRQRVDHTFTDYFRLKALGVDPDSPIIPHTKDSLLQSKRRQEEEKRAFVERSLRRPNSLPIPPQRDEFSSRTPREIVPQQTASSSNSTTVEDAFLKQLRETREAMAENEKWFKIQTEALEKEITKEEEFRRSWNGSQSTPQTSTNGMAVVNGYEYRPAEFKPGQSISRTERRIRETGAHGLATKPLISMSTELTKGKNKTSINDRQRIPQHVEEAGHHPLKKKRHRNVDSTYRPTADEDDDDEEDDEDELQPAIRRQKVPQSSKNPASSRPRQSHLPLTANRFDLLHDSIEDNQEKLTTASEEMDADGEDFDEENEPEQGEAIASYNQNSKFEYSEEEYDEDEDGEEEEDTEFDSEATSPPPPPPNRSSQSHINRTGSSSNSSNAAATPNTNLTTNTIGPGATVDDAFVLSD